MHLITSLLCFHSVIIFFWLHHQLFLFTFMYFRVCYTRAFLQKVFLVFLEGIWEPKNVIQLHNDSVVSTDVSQPEGPGFDPRIRPEDLSWWILYFLM